MRDAKMRMFVDKISKKARKITENSKSARRGISLVEVVVALTVVTIITAASFSLLAAHVTQESRSVASYTAASLAKSSVGCFRYADNEAELTTALESLDDGFTKDETNSTEDKLVYTLTEDSLKITLTVTVPSGTDTLDVGARLDFLATDRNDKEIYKTDYTKGH